MEEAVTDLVVNTEVRDLLNKVEVGIDRARLRPRPPPSVGAIRIEGFGKVKLDVGLARELGSKSHDTFSKVSGPVH